MTANPQTNSRLLDDTHTALAACDIDVTDVDKADHFVLATYATGDSPHGNDNADWKLEWRRVGGTFADVSATSEINWGAGTDVTPNVTDEQASVETDAGCLTSTDDSFNAGNNALNAAMGAPSGIGQMQWVLGFGAGALDNQEYEFQITNTTDTVSAICAATITTAAGVTTELITKTSNLRISILDQSITKTSNLRVKALGQSITKTSNLRIFLLQLITKTSNLRIKSTELITKSSNLRINVEQLITKTSNLAIKVFDQLITKTSNLRINAIQLITKTSNLAIAVDGILITKTSNLRIFILQLITKTSNLRIVGTELIAKTSNLAIAVDGLSITKTSNLRIVIVRLLTKTSNLRILGTELVQKSSNLTIKVFDQLITKTSNLRIVIVGLIQKTSNLTIKVFGLSVTKPSNLRVKALGQSITKTSNLRIFILQLITKTSNLRIGIADQLITKTSNLRIFILQTIQKTSNLRIFGTQLVTKTSNLDIKVIDNLIQKTSNLSIVIGGLKVIQKTSNLRVKALAQSITRSSNVRVEVPPLFTINVDDSDVGIVRKLMAQAGRQTIVSHVNDCLPVYASGSSDHTIYTDFQDIVDVAGIWLTDDIYHSGTNYLQGSIISPKDGVIEIGLNLPLGTEEILITYAHKDGLDDETIQLNVDMAKNYLQMELWKSTLNFSGTSNYETMAKWTMFSVATYYSLLTMNMSNAIQSGFNYRIAEFEIQTKLWGEGMIAETLLKSYWDRSMQMTKALKIFESNPDAPVYVVNRKNSRTPYNKDPTVFNTMMSSIAVSTLYDSRSEMAFIIKILG